MESQQKQDEIYKKEKEARQIKFRENTFCYIENYLNPNREWNKKVSAKQRIDLVRYSNVNWTAISDHIKEMDYQDFLATPYWKAITAHTKYKAGYRCQLCNNGADLATHHRNYDIHGREHAHMNELIVLCNNCHQKFHGKEEKSAPLRSSNITNMVVGLILLLIAYLLNRERLGYQL